MTSRSRRPTIQHETELSVVVIGGGLSLLGAVRQTVETLTVAQIVTSDVSAASNVIVQLRPFAVVISKELYDFDSSEFDALARDVQTSLIVVVTAGVSEVVLKSTLMSRISLAFSAHHRR